MDSSADIRQSCSFQAKKWTLFTFCAIGIVVMIIMASVAKNLMNTYYSEDENRESLKEAPLVLIWIISGFTILFFLVGLMGAYKEHYCMTVTYAVLITLSALGSISSATKNSYYWFETVLLFIICGVTYAYAYDLRRIRLLQFSAPTMMVVGGGAPVINTQVFMPPQYNNQYGQPSTAPPAQNNWQPPAYSAPGHKTNY